MGSNAKTRFRKGRSGNPGGKPKALLEVLAAIEEFKGDVPAVLRRLKGIALKDPDTKVAVAAIREFLDRTLGKAPQAVTVTGADGGALKMAHGIDLDSLSLEQLDRVRPLLAALEEALAGVTAKPG